ncbi:molybdopterin cofactor-binding domain-containing protein [Streptomyces chartreusis]
MSTELPAPVPDPTRSSESRSAPTRRTSIATTAFGGAVDAKLGLVWVRRMLGVHDAGRIIGPELAESQAVGGIVGAIGTVPLGHTVNDHRNARIVKAKLADYLAPLNADVPSSFGSTWRGRTCKPTRWAPRDSATALHVGVAPAIANGSSMPRGALSLRGGHLFVSLCGECQGS